MVKGWRVTQLHLDEVAAGLPRGPPPGAGVPLNQPGCHEPDDHLALPVHPAASPWPARRWPPSCRRSDCGRRPRRPQVEGESQARPMLPAGARDDADLPQAGRGRDLGSATDLFGQELRLVADLENLHRREGDAGSRPSAPKSNAPLPPRHHGTPHSRVSPWTAGDGLDALQLGEDGGVRQSVGGGLDPDGRERDRHVERPRGPGQPAGVELDQIRGPVRAPNATSLGTGTPGPRPRGYARSSGRGIERPPRSALLTQT
jgi:hypothetical protein